MRAFVSVARHGSFKLAARELNRTQPSITQAIQQLEEAVGIEVFDRTTRRVELTQEGREFVPVAKQLIEDFDSAIESICKTADKRRGSLNIAVLPSFGTALLPDILHAAFRRHPDIGVHVDTGTSEHVVSAVLEGRADVGVGCLPAQHPELQALDLMEDRLELVCHEKHALATEGHPVSWSEIRKHRFLSTRLQARDLAEEVTDISAVTVPDEAMLKAMLVLNLGVAALPALSLLAPETRLVSRPLIRPVSLREIKLIVRRGARLTPAAKLIVEITAETLPVLLNRPEFGNVQTKIRQPKFDALIDESGNPSGNTTSP